MATELHLTQSLIDLYIRVAFENVNGVYDILNSLGKMHNNKPTSVLETGNPQPPDGIVDYFAREGEYLVGYRAKHIPNKVILHNEIKIHNPIANNIVYNRAKNDFINYKTIKWKVAYVSTTSNILVFYTDNVILSVWNKDGNWNISNSNADRVYMILHSIIYDGTNPVEFDNLISTVYKYPINLRS